MGGDAQDPERVLHGEVEDEEAHTQVAERDAQGHERECGRETDKDRGDHQREHRQPEVFRAQLDLALPCEDRLGLLDVSEAGRPDARAERLERADRLRHALDRHEPGR